jgi:hypothetical protein
MPHQAAPPQAWPPQQQWTPPPPDQPQYQPQVHQHMPLPPQQAAWQPQPPPYQQYPQHDPAAHGHWPAQKQGPPAWLVGSGVAVALILVLGGAYYFMQPSAGKVANEKAQSAASAPTTQQAANPFQKYVEVVGIRLVAEKGKPVARVVIVNHSSAEINGLEANVTLWASTKRSEEDSIGTFKIRVPSLAANGSADATAPLTTRLKPYELPDWQNLNAELQITSPKP